MTLIERRLRQVSAFMVEEGKCGLEVVGDDVGELRLLTALGDPKSGSTLMSLAFVWDILALRLLHHVRGQKPTSCID